MAPPSGAESPVMLQYALGSSRTLVFSLAKSQLREGLAQVRRHAVTSPFWSGGILGRLAVAAAEGGGMRSRDQVRQRDDGGDVAFSVQGFSCPSRPVHTNAGGICAIPVSLSRSGEKCSPRDPLRQSRGRTLQKLWIGMCFYRSILPPSTNAGSEQSLATT